MVGDLAPALAGLAQDVGCTSLALRIEAVEVLVEPLLARFAGIYGAADLVHAALPFLCLRPKKAGPDQRVPVIARATSDRLFHGLPFQRITPSSPTCTIWTTPFHSRTSRIPGWSSRVTVLAWDSCSSRCWVRREKPPCTLACSSHASASRNRRGVTWGTGVPVSSTHCSRKAAGGRSAS